MQAPAATCACIGMGHEPLNLPGTAEQRRCHRQQNSSLNRGLVFAGCSTASIKTPRGVRGIWVVADEIGSPNSLFIRADDLKLCSDARTIESSCWCYLLLLAASNAQSRQTVKDVQICVRKGPPRGSSKSRRMPGYRKEPQRVIGQTRQRAPATLCTQNYAGPAARQRPFCMSD